MERSYRDPVLLRYGSQKSLGNPSCSPKLRLRNSDVDFSDVFGGPPRCSMMEKRHSTGETVNSLAFRGGKEAPPVRKSWPGLSEKPVFGGDSPNHRRQLGSDFFDDIFRGEDSVSTTAPRDPFSSMPASQTLSPARPLPPKVEQLSGGSSQPPLLGYVLPFLLLLQLITSWLKIIVVIITKALSHLNFIGDKNDVVDDPTMMWYHVGMPQFSICCLFFFAFAQL